MKSPKLAINVLLRLHRMGIKPFAVFDFINKKIEPKEASSEESIQLLTDYIDWLPLHFQNHECDLFKLKKLQITIWADLDNLFPSKKIKSSKFVSVHTITLWKAEGREEQKTKITQNENISNKSLEDLIPEF
ncbi:hypothetical protein GXP67_28605 [Rhodocytophaga rosea]|uniref:Uncharacterized protein n=1 Tax=Rhodocytophaga rosea TaxID=2704465 RepID=A0A6C0GRV2_9BACT|nr:hypothetical protein [Rhodocytophaga rosea]QHT70333.1 hypothetical protein GXP67_28605 [Rhodocytophaga rosea]